MRIDRAHLKFKALCALSEVVDQCDHAPLAPSLALRFALAYLFSISDGDRSSFDMFWQTIRQSDDAFHSATMARALRNSYARTAMTGIARSVGVELTVEYLQRLASCHRREKGPGSRI